MKALDAFTGGRVDLLIVPNSWHRADAAEFKRRYPSCKVLCPEEPRVRSAVEQHVRVDVGVALHSPCEELNKLDIKVHGPSGAFPGLVYELPVPDGVALVFCDVLFNVPKNHPMTRFQSFIAFYVTGSVGFFGVTRIGRLFGRLFGTLPKLKAWLQQQSERSDVTLIAVSHGTEVCGNAQCRDKLREAVARL
eukprot:CAMPEP_0175804638 /NCGR_PEP_ID=MMETSP0107_2-20121207/226_1 /TAXON_ID=195067 ORGANISM="Goniomonas pacifica, Strain CCMP1869" /NCGR_SAMPLE_ID=MMETSP0107_2 /ASSEMBLY_ACC=CAM_ASM_000203 /LENGTH=191 /DNA_ID=CAMNT_0017115999 /DNA_START=96 /DNA_END=671 /DNA_ORIENTATION=+